MGLVVGPGVHGLDILDVPVLQLFGENFGFFSTFHENNSLVDLALAQNLPQIVELQIFTHSEIVLFQLV